MAIDTLGYVKALKAVGVPAAQAEAHAEALRDTVVPNLATQQDLRDATTDLRTEMAAMKTELKTEIADLRTDMWRMGMAMVLATTTLVTFAQKLFH